jgi:hypothetical protein
MNNSGNGTDDFLSEAELDQIRGEVQKIGTEIDKPLPINDSKE